MRDKTTTQCTCLVLNTRRLDYRTLCITMFRLEGVGIAHRHFVGYIESGSRLALARCK